MRKKISTIVNLFPLWACVFAGVAFFYPSFFIHLKIIILPLLALVMLSMGMTLTGAAFKASPYTQV